MGGAACVIAFWTSACPNVRRAPARAAVELDESEEFQVPTAEKEPGLPEALDLKPCDSRRELPKTSWAEVSPLLKAALIRELQREDSKSFLSSAGDAFRFSTKGLEATVSSSGAFALDLSNARTSTSGARTSTVYLAGINGLSIPPAHAVGEDNQVRLQRPHLEEAFLQGPFGFMQSLHVDRPASSPSTLRLEFAVERLGVASGTVAAAATYATDAAGRLLAGRWEPTEIGRTLIVETMEAQWPVDADIIWSVQHDGPAEEDAAASELPPLRARVLGAHAVLRIGRIGEAKSHARVYVFVRTENSWSLAHTFLDQEARRVGHRMAVGENAIALGRVEPYDLMMLQNEGGRWRRAGLLPLSSCPLAIQFDGDIMAVLQAHGVTTWRRSDGAWRLATDLELRNEDTAFPKDIEDAREISLAGGWLALNMRRVRGWQEIRRSCDWAGCTNHVAFPYQLNYALRIYPIDDTGTIGSPFEKPIGFSARYYRWTGGQFSPDENAEGWQRASDLLAGEDAVTFKVLEANGSMQQESQAYVMRRTSRGWSEPTPEANPGDANETSEMANTTTSTGGLEEP